jgi:hypothetical protein
LGGDPDAEQLAHHEPTIGFLRYLTSSSFGQAVTENWQSEFLQFALFVLATIWLLQRGSPESKELDEAGTLSDKEQKIGRYARHDSPLWARTGDIRTTIYSNSLIIVMTLVFLGSWFAQSVTGRTEYNQAQVDHGQPRLSWSPSRSARRPSMPPARRGSRPPGGEESLG